MRPRRCLCLSRARKIRVTRILRDGGLSVSNTETKRNSEPQHADDPKG